MTGGYTIEQPLNIDNLIPTYKHPVVQELGRLFEKAGKRLYLVGGTVRDALLGQFHEDLDFATDARPGEAVEIIKPWADNLWLVGVRFGTVGLSKGHLKIEITTLRSEVYRGKTRHPEVKFGTDIYYDLSRRDFTINAMALEFPKGQLIDPFNGQSDLVNRMIRTPLSPEQSFSDDPLRMMRAIRFVSTMGMHLSPEVEEAIIKYKGELARVSSERIRDEFSKILIGREPTKALRLLLSTSLSDKFVPELSKLKITQDPDFHHKDVLEHTLLVVERVERDLVLRLAALFHDVGKPDTKEIIEGKVTFYNHDTLGAYITRKRLRALKYPKTIVEDVAKLIYLHMRVYTYRMGWTDKAVRKYIRDTGDLRAKLNALIRADCTTKNPRKMRQSLRVLDELEERIIQLEEIEETAKIRPPIDGHEVMKYLGIGQGPLVGEALHLLLEAKLAGEIETKEEAFELIDRWAKEKGIKG
ncbi:MAG: CCA tRNA nucleotidyltransferase [Actinobacteria bacterium]|nr:CCA tRNA nucleotidyltransferase [Actinomycetota bacterium]